MGNLVATQVKQSKASAKTYKLPDGEGLYLLVTPKGGQILAV